MFNASWTSARTDQIRLSIAIAGARCIASLMTPAHARQQGIDWEHSVRGEDVDGLVRKGMRKAQNKRLSSVRLQLAGSRGRPQERILVVSGVPTPSKSGKSEAADDQSMRTRTQPASLANQGNLTAQQSRQFTKHERQMTQALTALQAAVAGQPELQDALRLLKARIEKVEDIIDTMAPMVEGLRQQWRASQGHAPTATGLPQI